MREPPISLKFVKSHHSLHSIRPRFESGVIFLGISFELPKKTVRKRDQELKQEQMQRATLFGWLSRS
jgi:hypothetical protein